MAANVTVRLRQDTATRWTQNNPKLYLGEPGYETDTGRFKIGDGLNHWTNLEYFTVNQDAVLHAELLAQVNAILAESVYDDDGPSLLLLYQNAKV